MRLPFRSIPSSKDAAVSSFRYLTARYAPAETTSRATIVFLYFSMFMVLAGTCRVRTYGRFQKQWIFRPALILVV